MERRLDCRSLIFHGNRLTRLFWKDMQPIRITPQPLSLNNEREFTMLKNFENWLLENNYSASTSADYSGRIERLCRNEQFTLSHLVENITSILPQYETTGEKASYGKRSHRSVRQALRRFKMFLASEKLA